MIGAASLSQWLHSCSYFMAATVEIASVSDTGTTKTTWSSRQCKEFLFRPLGSFMPFFSTLYAFWLLLVTLEVPFLTLVACPKEWKHHSKVSSWKLRTARNARMVTRGNLLALITAQNAVFAFSRWTIIVPGLTTA